MARAGPGPEEGRGDEEKAGAGATMQKHARRLGDPEIRCVCLCQCVGRWLDVPVWGRGELAGARGTGKRERDLLCVWGKRVRVWGKGDPGTATASSRRHTRKSLGISERESKDHLRSLN